MYLDRHDSREDLSTRINRRHDPVGGFDVLLKRFRVASILGDESLDGESRGEWIFDSRHYRGGLRDARIERCKFFFSLHCRSSRRKDIVAGKGRIFTRFPPLYLSLLDPCAGSARLDVRTIRGNLWRWIQPARFLRVEAINFARSCSNIDFLPFLSEREINSLGADTLCPIMIGRRNNVAECNCGSASAILWPGCIGPVVQKNCDTRLSVRTRSSLINRRAVRDAGSNPRY